MRNSAAPYNDSGETFVTQYGPEMHGNKPVDEERK